MMVCNCLMMVDEGFLKVYFEVMMVYWGKMVGDYAIMTFYYAIMTVYGGLMMVYSGWGMFTAAGVCLQPTPYFVFWKIFMRVVRVIYICGSG